MPKLLRCGISVPVAKAVRYLVLALMWQGGWSVLGIDWDTYQREDYEEPAGVIVSVEFNPSDGIFGISGGDGTWLKGTPVFGDFFISTFYNDIEEALYGGIGMTLRLMPHWEVAPFLGGGASYNQYIVQNNDEVIIEDPEAPEPGESYWGGHVEGGIRYTSENRFYEMLVRYTWSSSEIEDPDYGLIRIGYGFKL